MRQKEIDNYKKIKGLLFFAKQAFLNERGREIIPTLENLEIFKEKLNEILHLVDEIKDGIQGES